jgi:PTS system beta-glucosides-specific IIC component
MEYEELCQNILEHVGGSDNINQAFHCITRLRLIVKDKSKVDFDALKQVEGVLQVLDAAGQVQVVIGTQVEAVYHEFCEVAGIPEGGGVDVDYDPGKDDEGDILTQTMSGNSDSAKSGRFSWVTRLLDALAAIVTPALYGIIAGGMLKGVTATIVAFGWLTSKDPNIVVLNAIADAPFYFMPFVIGYSSANRFKIDPAFGLCVAGMIMYPTFMSNADGLTSLPFLFFSIPIVNYKNTIFPVILGVWVFSLIFKLIDKHIHKNVRIVFSGFLTFLVAGPVILAFVAPLGNWIGVGMAAFFGTLFTVAGPLAGALFCGIIPLTIIFGIKGWSVVELDNLNRLGYDYMLPNFFYSNLAVSGAVLAASLKLKQGSSRKSTAVSTGLLAILGVTEPALYGIAVPMKMPLYASMAGGAIAGAVATLLSVRTYAFSMPGITSIATYVDGGSNFFMLLITMAVAWASSFAISYVLTKKEAA